MPAPAFVAALAREDARPRLRATIHSGFLIALGFALIALAAQLLGVLPRSGTPYLLVAIKLVFNVGAWLALRQRRLVALGFLTNIGASCVLLTGAIYITGGLQSPLFVIYLIEVTVLALLTDQGTTLFATLACGLLYAAMGVATYTGLLPTTQTPFAHAGELTPGYLVAALSVAAFVLGITGLFINRTVSLLRAKEAALEKRTRQLMRASTQKTEFMANVTHELRTPIHGILGLAELMSEQIYGPLNRRQLEACENIRRSATAQLNLVDELLLLSRAEVGKMTHKEVPTDLSKLLPSVVASVRWMLAGKALDLRVEVDERLPPVLVDRGKLNHVLLNLVGNAAKFTPEGGEVRVRATLHGESAVTFEVRDNGVGIPPEQLEAIFEAFHQVDGSDERAWGGAGLGLSIVARLVQAMGGEVQVDSTVGQGSAFRVTLPIGGLGDLVAGRTRPVSRPFPGAEPSHS